MSFENDLSTAQAEVQQALDTALAPFGDDPVAEAMRYATRGGKRLRAFLALEAAALFDVPRARALRAAAAIECVHAYSLIHDDLPCMDDDDLRRGQPTVHRRWDEATAVLAGDALQTLAFELLADPETHPDPAVRADLVLTLARDAGAQGMVRGQALDIAAETAAAPLTLDQVSELQRLKTGRLLEWPCRAGALLGGADPGPLVDYAGALGLAFQIADDLLDVEGDAEKAGKALRKDAAAGKATFVSLLGAEAARARAMSLVRDAEMSILIYTPKGANLGSVARYVVTRDR
ncbi:polyprenyl synthetase family protein [Jannaschia seohaensis]|uniref:Geranylgeranyl diphosphate synthase n=1 Tax=Jannaschia seohaensis TaxID=475081 RepID=A0A2Y9B316_9RHOB|nr:farnesyl diphosphate synthase [Jannaschia seohaensis]PWJ16512.1 farnesyl diphosphate synthase [Jannaschia seohaensis]SSA48749.1 farnesyl diphosphate synthase [Jannaschia seohaensis]